ncbi:hypothetical protein [Mesorhizobium sp. 1B3]|uniref:hypothetical protein n=1 Tax=Mesorhizobium sp. 1B3 TaxID=3243599 RepID=UPI003D9696B8
MNRIWGLLLLAPLAACNGSVEDKAVQACETVFAALEAGQPPEKSGKAKLEKKELQGDRVHLLIHGPNGLGEMIFTDLNCMFKLDRQPTERDATLKLSKIEIGRSPESVSRVDSYLKDQGHKTVTERLKEKGLDAILPSETKIKLKD